MNPVHKAWDTDRVIIAQSVNAPVSLANDYFKWVLCNVQLFNYMEESIVANTGKKGDL